MVTTRSSTTATKQTQLDDFTADKKDAKADSPQRERKPQPAKSAPKRKPSAPSSSPVLSKKQRHTESREQPKPKPKPKPEKKQVAKSKSGQTKLDTENVTEQLASPASTKSYQKQTEGSVQGSAEASTKAEPKGDFAAEDDVVVINRSPVLTLWAACVAQFLHPKVSWQTCLSVGSAAASLCAVSKGKSIGVVDAPDDTEERKEAKKKEKNEKEGLEEIEVMGFKLLLKDGMAMVGKDRKKANKGALEKKYGTENYERVKNAFEEGLQSWQNKKEDLDKKAFSMYEEFRPNVAAGTKGWGRRGELSLENIQRSITNG